MSKDLKLIVAAIAIAGLVFATSSSVQAKSSFVKGASCKTCHEGKPAKKDNVTKKAAEMMKKYKAEECKDCHGWEDGKFTTKKKK
jgi:nitrate/TMAO reductase-like tetraheme cytochrome c subunit